MKYFLHIIFVSEKRSIWASVVTDGKERLGVASGGGCVSLPLEDYEIGFGY